MPWDPLNPPDFEEDESLRAARRSARALAASQLAVYVLGELGTGRRTLARAIADVRANGEKPIIVEPGVALLALEDGSSASVLVHGIEHLDAPTLARLARAIAAGVRCVAWGTAASLASLPAESRLLFENGLVRLPPLRERGDDVARWAKHFAARWFGRPLELTPDAELALMAEPWPGNLGQLDGLIVRTLALRESNKAAPISANELGLAPPSTSSRQGEGRVEPLSKAVERFRRDYIRAAVERCGGNRSRAAQALGVDPRTVFRYLQSDREGDDPLEAACDAPSTRPKARRSRALPGRANRIRTR